MTRQTNSLLTITQNLVPVMIILLLLHEYLFQKLDTRITKCTLNSSNSREFLKSTTFTLNLNRIKMFYVKKGDFFIPSSLKQKDWHNYTQIELEKQRVGIGEQGKPFRLPKEDKAKLVKFLYMYGYNAALSEKIALDRSLPDIRHENCKKRLYLESLPTVSIIVPFRNEHWSTLLRTVHSVLNRSPENLIKEIFLVDDASHKAYLKENFDQYVENNLPKVKLIHLANHSGLVAARLTGAKEATADVLIFLDSHTEANINWLPPLLEPIALDYRTAVEPLVNAITYDTFEYRLVDEGARGTFDWGLTYQRLSLIPKDLNNLPEPFETPVMYGGLLAISRKFFWELGGYDPGLRHWGGEQYELSFKIWQCGGRLLEVPCSHVGHVYRIFDPPGQGDYTSRNFRRVAEVWMDEYAEYVYARRPDDRLIDPGDLTEQKALRERLKCKPFSWFLSQIAFDLTQQFPVVDPLPYAEGRIRPTKSHHLCIDGNHGGWNAPVVLKQCHPSRLKLPMEQDDQKFILSWFNDVRLKSRYLCWDLKYRVTGSHLTLYPCHHGGGNQVWRYYENEKRFIYIDGSLCLDHNPRNYDLYLNQCYKDSETQLWDIDTIHKEQMSKWNLTNALRVTGPTEEWKD